MNRRRFLGGMLGALLGNAGAGRGLAAPSVTPDGGIGGRAKRCVLLWMDGGPSQLETFDPKPGTGTGGPTKSISTNVPGIEIAEHLPEVARRMDRLTVLRNVTSEEGEHERARYYLHTGYTMVPAFPRPALGSVVSHERPESDLPKYVLLGDDVPGPAYCGPDHASFAIGDAGRAQELLGRIRRRRDDLAFLRELNADFDTRNDFPAVRRRSSMIERIDRLASTGFRDTLRIERESELTRARYGETGFGRRCLLARRLLENGVPFVEVQLGGWDTHVNNFRAVAELGETIDKPWAALMDDLVSSGLWDDTLVVWMGEFGRTPSINGQGGRDHFPNVTPVVIGGGCVRTGQVVGATNFGGTAVEGDSHRVADVSATLLDAMGVSPDQEFTTDFGSPTTATDGGQVISALRV